MEKLLKIQSALKCNKGQYNSFGRYKYRSCEDILESVKPLLAEYKCTLILSDTLEYIGDRYYIKATATLTDVESNKQVQNTAYAREEESKKGMDGSQITGTASSYARKYALNGLFAIDDTKDADTDEYHKTTSVATITEEQEKELRELANKLNPDEVIVILTHFGYKKLKEITTKDYETIKKELGG